VVGVESTGAGHFALGLHLRAARRTQLITLSELAVVGAVLGMVTAFELLRPVHAVNPGARTGLETLIAVCAVATVGLLKATIGRSRQLMEVLLLWAMLVLAIAALAYAAAGPFPGIWNRGSGGGIRVAFELVAGLAFAAAALSPRKSTASSGRRLVRLGVAVSAGCLALGILLVKVAGAVGSPSTAGGGVGVGGVARDPMLVAEALTSAAVLAIASVAFLARSRRGETRTRTLAGACLLLAGASLQHLTIPTVPSGWVTPSDGLRGAAYALLLGSAYLQYAKFRRHETYAAISAERERIARDLHDGLTQDLACIAAQGQRLDCQLGPEHPLMLAARRAIAVTRGVIADLTASSAPTTEAALRMIGDELEHRFELEVNVRVEADPPLSQDSELEPAQRENLILIAREAIVNAALHGTARHVDVVLLRRRGTLLMRVSDDGRGLAADHGTGFGLRTMRARAASLGGELETHSRAGGGTELELLVS
jgi:signal transduction histidine kinase